ncbi:MAG: hypothetical protein EHJ94_01125 [Deltaproteobacteria bacterium]|nr:MAG: hypothetical protein EHJ94_01125 [Deltaproteobacteria bacterium]
METLEDLRNKIQHLEAEIQETKKRLPAHSVKPPVMMDLLDLEDERDRLLKRVRELQENGSGTV